MSKILYAVILVLVFPITAYSQTYMSEEEMMEKVVGHKVKAISAEDGKTEWTEYYKPNKKGKPKGKIKGTWAGKPYHGKWKIKDGKWCFSYPSGTNDGCYYLEWVNDTTLKSYKKDGTLVNTLTIVE